MQPGFFNLCKLSVHSMWSIFKKNIGLLFGLLLLSEALNQYFLKMHSLLASSHQFDNQFFLLNDIGKFSSSMLIEGLLLFLVPMLIHNSSKEKPDSLYLSLKRHFSHLSIEFLRATAVIIRWGVLFIIPGLYQHLKLLFVPFVVLFSKNYDDGHADALASSKKLTEGQIGKLLFFFITFSAIEALAFSPLMNTFIFDEPLKVLILSPLSFLFDVFFYSFFYFYYLKRSEVLSFEQV